MRTENGTYTLLLLGCLRSSYEKDPESGLYYAGARYQVSRLGSFNSTDPMWHKYPHLTPYHYCSNNPIMRVDPNGMEDDWIYNKITKTYIWRDDVSSETNLSTMNAIYVGANDNDILAHMGLKPRYETQTSVDGGIGFVGGGDKNVGPLGQGIMGNSVAKVRADLFISVNVEYDLNNATEYNRLGKTFEGVNVTTYVSERIVNSNNDLQSNSGGYFSVMMGNKEYSAGLTSPTSASYTSPNWKSTSAFVNIHANQIIYNHLNSATISIGRPNPSLLYNRPTKISWNLRTK